jgi:hypothetical protein
MFTAMGRVDRPPGADASTIVSPGCQPLAFPQIERVRHYRTVHRMCSQYLGGTRSQQSFQCHGVNKSVESTSKRGKIWGQASGDRADEIRVVHVFSLLLCSAKQPLTGQKCKERTDVVAGTLAGTHCRSATPERLLSRSCLQRHCSLLFKRRCA